MLRGFITADRDQVVLAPEEYGCYDGYCLPAETAPRMLTSETPEEVYVWRARLAEDADLLATAEDTFGRLLDAVYGEKREAVVEAAAKTLDNLRAMRQGLDHLQVALGTLEGEWAEKARVAVAEFTADYVKMATAVYGNALALDADTRMPVLPEGLDAYPFLEGLAVDIGAPPSELDAVGLGAAFAAAVDQFGGEVEGGAGGGAGSVNEIAGDGAPLGAPAAYTIIDSLALSPVGLAVAARLTTVTATARKIIDQLAQRADKGR